MNAGNFDHVWQIRSWKPKRVVVIDEYKRSVFQNVPDVGVILGKVFSHNGIVGGENNP